MICSLVKAATIPAHRRGPIQKGKGAPPTVSSNLFYAKATPCQRRSSLVNTQATLPISRKLSRRPPSRTIANDASKSQVLPSRHVAQVPRWQHSAQVPASTNDGHTYFPLVIQRVQALPAAVPIFLGSPDVHTGTARTRDLPPHWILETISLNKSRTRRLQYCLTRSSGRDLVLRDVLSFATKY